jgi:hypothetical protein
MDILLIKTIYIALLCFRFTLSNKTLIYQLFSKKRQKFGKVNFMRTFVNIQIKII